MTTKPRVVVPNAYYQIRSEAAPGLRLFPSPRLRKFFIAQLKRLLKETSYTLKEISLHQDHYHLVVKAGEVPVSWFMRTLNSIFAKYLNNYYKRHGTVFPRRFTSAVLDEKYGLKEIACHVHLNPLRKGRSVCEIIKGYDRNCSEGFGELWPQRTRSYVQFLKTIADSAVYEEIIRRHRRSNRLGQQYSDPRVSMIGKKAFEDRCLGIHQCRIALRKQNQRRDPFLHLSIFHRKLSAWSSFMTDDLYLQGYRNRISEVRETFVLLGVYLFEFSGADLARYLGITRSAVSRMISRCAASMRQDTGGLGTG